MADERTVDLASITGASVADGDLFHVVDVSDTSMDTDGTDKKITRAQAKIALTPAFVDLTDVDTTGLADGDVFVWDAGTSTLVPAAGGVLSDTDPVALGAASEGTANEASRQDHVHPTTGLALDADVVHDTGNETVAGTKTFSSAPSVPDASFSIAKTSGLQTALDAKAADSAAVHVTGTETVAGVKTFSSSPVVPDSSFTIAKTTGLQTALDAKAADSAAVHVTGTETVAGVKTFSSSPVVPDSSFTIAKTTGLQTALDAKAADSLAAHLAGTETITGTKTFSVAPSVPNASFTVAKLSTTGTASATTVLRGDGVWATPPWHYFNMPFLTGEYFTEATSEIGSNTTPDTQSRLYYTPMYLRAGTIDRFAVRHTANGGASDVLRMGLYADSGSFAPTGAAVVDGGTVAMNAGAQGVKSVTVSTVITEGLYWLASVAQGGITFQVNTQGTATPNGHYTRLYWASDLANTQAGFLAYYEGSVTGSLPTVGSLTKATFASANKVPIVFVRYSSF